MELKDIKDLMKVLKDEEMSEMKVRYGKIKLTLVNSEIKKEEPKIEKVKLVETVKTEANIKKEETIKSQNVGVIKLSKLEKGMKIQKGMVLAKINTIGIDTDVKATVNGTLVEILIADNSAVDFAKPLFIIEIE